VRLLWLKVYAPAVPTNSSATSVAWDAQDTGGADGLLAEDGDTIVDGAVPRPERDWSITASPRRIAPWVGASARRSSANSTAR
jgi:hypothetical protein